MVCRGFRALIQMSAALCLLAQAARGGDAGQRMGDAGFEANRGQYEQSVLFVAHVPGYSMVLGCGGQAVYATPADAGFEPSSRLSLENPSACSEGRGEAPMPGISNFYIGSALPSGTAGVPHYERVRFRGVFPGVDMLWVRRHSDAEYQFHVAAGGDPRRIQMRITGFAAISVDPSGDLLLQSPGRVVRHRRPRAFQTVDGKITGIDVAYRVKGAIIGFRLSSYRA